MAEVFLNENLPEEIFGAPKAGAGMWASCIRVMDPIQGKTVQKIKLEQNEAAMSLCFVKFNVQPEFTFCLVGVAKDYKLNPRSAGGGKYNNCLQIRGKKNREIELFFYLFQEFFVIYVQQFHEVPHNL